MRQDDRAPFVQALDHARISAYPPGEFVGQESFMLASEIITVARQAGVGPGVQVLDLCCGIAGPGRHLSAELGCDYVGLDYSAGAIQIARDEAAARGLSCRFDVAHLPPIPPGLTPAHADVVLLLETILAFEDKVTLLDEVARVLEPGGRFALTLEAGVPLTPAERQAMPDADTVWLETLPELTRLLDQAGMKLTWEQESTQAHHAMAGALLAAFRSQDDAIARQIGRRALDELIAAHQLWSDWLGTGRVRKFALVATKL